MAKIKQVKKFVDGLEAKHLEALARLANSDEIKEFYALVRLKKQEILRDQFTYPSRDPLKNALNKERLIGQDEALTFIVNSFKKSADLLDQMEEDASKSNKK